jgi:hypothetical protein
LTQPHGFVNAPNRGYAAQPANSTIFGAAKLTGRVGAFSIGALNAITSREDASVLSAPGLPVSRTAVEPASSYRSRGRIASSRTTHGWIHGDEHQSSPSKDCRICGFAITGGIDGDCAWARARTTSRATGPARSPARMTRSIASR